MNTIFVNFQNKQVVTEQDSPLSSYELDQFSLRIDELSELIDQTDDDTALYSYECEVEDILSKINNSMILIRNQKSQKRLVGKRKKNQPLKRIV